ncbi:hypothetical protein [Microlunatus phosphovorus]|uniref:hypothetical protein n=1 Tax=Microlunatus phosphovorus TaxID=29405 RepID=UPI0012EA61A8|nr:hypothetical protein [Microlunatus phosphovorus]
MSVRTLGSGAAARAGVAQGPNSLLFPRSNQVVEPTGTTPSATQSSCSFSPTVTIRWRADSTVVLPYLWSIVTG